MVRWLGPRGGGDLQVLLKKECSISGGDMSGGRYTQPLQDGKKIKLSALRSGVM